MSRLITLTAALFDVFNQGLQLVHEGLHMLGIIGKGLRPWVDLTL
jgi:hypothetical protein